VFCQKCGTQIADDAAFCSSCGTNVKTRPKASPVPLQMATPEANQPTADSVRRAMEDKEINDAGIGCLGVILLVVACVIGAAVGGWVHSGWVGFILVCVIFGGGMIWLANKRYPR